MLQHGTSGHKRNVGILFVGERRRGGSNKNKSKQKHIYKTYKTIPNPCVFSQFDK